MIDHIADYLEQLLVDMCRRLEANNMLVFVEKCVVAETELTSALIGVWNV